MSKRGIIGFIAANPEDVFQQRMMDGIFDQCRKYGYDCAVFSPLVKADLFFKEYLNGELNILELINFDMLDGVIVAAFSLIEGQTVEGRPMWVKDYVADLLAKRCKKPVVSLGLPLNDYPVLCTDDRTSLEEITDHLIEVHGCKKMLFLSGLSGNNASDDRLNGFKDSVAKHGLTFCDDTDIFYGNFWYPGGEHLADKIISGEVEKPDAVVCANDYMAIGLINRLAANGIKVPDDIMVTGFDATLETVMNKITVTSFLPAAAPTAAEAVNIIIKQLDPEAKVLPVTKGETGLKPCASCGCPENLAYIKDTLINKVSSGGHESYRITGSIDINDLLDSYMFENMTSTESVSACISQIADSINLLRPYEKYYLCLSESWIDADRCTVHGYPDTMRIVIEGTGPTCSGTGHPEVEVTDGSEKTFDTSLMLPDINEDRDHPCVFYFAPVHFRENAMGYSVLRCELGGRKIDAVFRNWLRNVNNALEMIRAQKRLTVFSERDAMTGLYNRRGMEAHIKELTAGATARDNWLVFVIDMDGLKHINDTYGHKEGDYGITAVASAARQIARSSEICVRAGGDEFYVIGLGEYKYIDAVVRVERFKEALAEENKEEKPYEISASIGFCCEPFRSPEDIHDLINLSDGRMYENKTQRKKAR